MYVCVFCQPQEKWMVELEDQDVPDTEPTATLYCKFSKAKCHMHWYKNKMEIFQGQKYKFVNNDGEFKLLITKLCLDDSGQYTCEADCIPTSMHLIITGSALIVTSTLIVFPHACISSQVAPSLSLVP